MLPYFFVVSGILIGGGAGPLGYAYAPKLCQNICLLNIYVLKTKKRHLSLSRTKN